MGEEGETAVERSGVGGGVGIGLSWRGGGERGQTGGMGWEGERIGIERGGGVRGERIQIDRGSGVRGGEGGER